MHDIPQAQIKLAVSLSAQLLGFKMLGAKFKINELFISFFIKKTHRKMNKFFFDSFIRDLNLG